MSTILAVAEQVGGVVQPVSYEIFTLATRLQGRVVTLMAGATPVVEGHTVEGAEKSIVVMVPESPDAKAEAIAHVARELKADVILMAATATGKDVMACVATRLGVSLLQDCIACAVENGALVFTRPLYGGKVLADVCLTTHPVLATIRPRVCTAADERKTSVIETLPFVYPEPLTVAEIIASSGQDRPDVTEAQIVVSGGRGLRGPDNWHILEALVEALGSRATLACSRPVSDDGWRPREEHVGQTGRTISPDLYVACGISGAIQHVAGITGSKCIVAINKDPEAPIFKVADYGIVGDLFEVVPQLTSAILALRDG